MQSEQRRLRRELRTVDSFGRRRTDQGYRIDRRLSCRGDCRAEAFERSRGGEPLALSGRRRGDQDAEDPLRVDLRVLAEGWMGYGKNRLRTAATGACDDVLQTPSRADVALGVQFSRLSVGASQELPCDGRRLVGVVSGITDLLICDGQRRLARLRCHRPVEIRA